MNVKRSVSSGQKTPDQLRSQDIAHLPEDVQEELLRLRRETHYVELQVALAKRRTTLYLQGASGEAAVQYIVSNEGKGSPRQQSSTPSPVHRLMAQAGTTSELDASSEEAQLFSLFDVDGDGKLDTEDFRMLIENCEAEYDDDEYNRAFLAFDTGLKDCWNQVGGSGVVSRRKSQRSELHVFPCGWSFSSTLTAC